MYYVCVYVCMNECLNEWHTTEACIVFIAYSLITLQRMYQRLGEYFCFLFNWLEYLKTGNNIMNCVRWKLCKMFIIFPLYEQTHVVMIVYTLRMRWKWEKHIMAAKSLYLYLISSARASRVRSTKGSTWHAPKYCCRAISIVSQCYNTFLWNVGVNLRSIRMPKTVT
jgi:hypothetical protein